LEYACLRIYSIHFCLCSFESLGKRFGSPFEGLLEIDCLCLVESDDVFHTLQKSI
jgi:hypothetical protein